MHKESIPRYIDDQYQVLFWEIDEVAILVMCFGLGIVFELLAPLVGLGFAFIYSFRRWKYHHMEGILLHICYWHGLMNLNKLFKNGLEREFNS